MKKYLLITFISFGLIACGGSSDESEQDSVQAQEAEVVEGINSDIENAQEELATEVEENLSEIDSLLQNVE